MRVEMSQPVFCSYLTNRGCLRSGNEDSILVAGTVISGVSMDSPRTITDPIHPALFCVADGVGGSVDGEVASRTVLEFFSRYSRYPKSAKDAQTLIAEAKEVLDAMVIRDPSSAGLGTTVSGLVWFADSAFVINCGDSRVYRMENGKIERLSHDHSLVQELCDEGVITDDQVYTHPLRNIITAVISGDLHRPVPPVMTASYPISGRERFLVCTDGLWEVIRDPEIFSICSVPDISQAAIELLQTCLARGGPDNISLILIGPAW